MQTGTDHEEGLPHNDGAKGKRIDLGLALLAAMAPPRAALTAQDIAAWCGCTASMISSIEARALRRMREKVRVQFKLSQSNAACRRRFLAMHFQS